VADRLPSFTVIPIRIAGVEAAVSIGIKVQVLDQLVAFAPTARTAHSIVWVAEGVAVGCFVIRANPLYANAPSVVAYHVQLIERTNIDQTVVIGVVANRRGVAFHQLWAFAGVPVTIPASLQRLVFIKAGASW